MQLEVGMLIKTNYSGAYRIISIKRGCTCPHPIDYLNGQGWPPQPPHIHLVCTDPDNARHKYYLGYFNEDTLLSLHKSYCGHKTKLDYDRIIVLEQDKPFQTTLKLEGE